MKRKTDGLAMGLGPRKDHHRTEGLRKVPTDLEKVEERVCISREVVLYLHLKPKL